MKQKTPVSNKAQKRLTAAEQAKKEARYLKMQTFQVRLGWTFVAIAVAGAFAMAFFPQAMGMKQGNPAIGFGLALLAGFRILALRKELRNQDLPAK